MESLTIFWHRRDLRLHDNKGLHDALLLGSPVQPVFILDTAILDKLDNRTDKRVSFIYDQLIRLNKAYQQAGSSLWVFAGKPEEVFSTLLNKYPVKAIYANADYEPYSLLRDQRIASMAIEKGALVEFTKDHVILEPHEVLKEDGKPYTVYTPYMKAWRKNFEEKDLDPAPSEKLIGNLNNSAEDHWTTLEDIGFTHVDPGVPSYRLDANTLSSYAEQRDIPAVEGTTGLSTHLRFGTVSTRQVFRDNFNRSEKFINEMIWREFYQQIMWHFPQTADRCCRPTYERINWRNNEVEFAAWCSGQTGYPMVDAGMRELNATGLMHNRARMITASFLTKHLLIDWRWGERYFAGKLLDFDLASNVGNWQWAAGCGVDAAPYFRVFNPTTQAKKFDPASAYIQKWVPELDDKSRYPQPIVDHKFARERALETYKTALNKG